MSRILLLGAGGPATVAVTNLITGSNDFTGTRVWAVNDGGPSTMTLTSGPAITNSVTSETYWNFANTGSSANWRYDTNDADDTWTPAGSTQYTFSLYYKKGSNQTTGMTVRTLGGTDATSSTGIVTTSWTHDTGSLAGAHNQTGGDGPYFTDLGGNEARLGLTITTPSGTNRILWEITMASFPHNVYVSSCMIHAGSGFATYSSVA